jgi:hypothetical protein
LSPIIVFQVVCDEKHGPDEANVAQTAHARINFSDKQLALAQIPLVPENLNKGKEDHSLTCQKIGSHEKHWGQEITPLNELAV